MSLRPGKRKGAAQGQSYQEVLGIRVGDVVTTSYGTGPYEVWAITSPRQVTYYPTAIIVRAWPVVDLALIELEEAARGARGRFFGARWFTDRQDEVLVQTIKRVRALPVHPTRSYPPLSEPYAFQQGVDYHAGHRQVWHCVRCGQDWNETNQLRRWEVARCHVCCGVGTPIVSMADPTISQSECVLAMNA